MCPMGKHESNVHQHPRISTESWNRALFILFGIDARHVNMMLVARTHQTLPLQTFHTPHRRFFMKGQNSICIWNEGSRRTQDMRTRRSSLWNGKALGLGAWDYGICEMIECSRHPRSLLVSEVQGLRTNSSPFCMMLRALFFNPWTIHIFPGRISDMFKQFP